MLDVVVDVLDNSGQTMFVATEFGVFTTVDGGSIGRQPMMA